MGKNNNQKQNNQEDEVDIFAQLTGEGSPDILITSEEAITITLFEDEPAVELTEEDDDFETNIFSNKKKVTADDEDNDFDSYFFEE